MMQKPHAHKQAFTLIELSIVLVIIGLLAGGVLVGRELIYAAQLRKVGTELQQYQTAISTFKCKYGCLPGDCAKATTWFGAYVGPNSCFTVAATNDGDGATSGTCNGTGDDTVNAWGSFGYPLESYYAWQQLSLARLIPGNYPGGGKLGPILLSPGVNIPASIFSPKIGYHLFTETQLVTNWGWISPFTLVIQIGSVGTGGTDFLWGPGFKAPDAQALDTKIDDGNPNGGILSAHDALDPSTSNPNTTCLSGTAYSTSTATGCIMYYNMKF